MLKLHYLVLAFAITVTATIAVSDSFVSPELTDRIMQNYKKLSEDWRNNTEMKLWLERLDHRIKTQPKANPTDLKRLWRAGVDVSKQLKQFVTSPAFNTTTDIIIEKTIQFVKPIVGVMPLREIKEFYNIIRNNPDILEIVLDNNNVFDNKTRSYVVDRLKIVLHQFNKQTE